MKGAIVFCGIGIHIVQSSKLNEEGSLYLTDKTMAISRLNNVAFIHVPKTAGSFVSQSCLFDDARMRHAIGGHYPYREVFRHKYSRNMTSVTSFTIVREPCERFVSAYAYLTSGLGNKGDTIWTKAAIGNKTASEYALELSLEGLNNAWAHFLPQLHFISDHGKVMADLVMTVHNLSSGMKMLARLRPDLKTTIKCINLRNKINKSRHKGCKTLTKKAQRAIQKVYSMDYRILGKLTNNFTAPFIRTEL